MQQINAADHALDSFILADFNLFADTILNT